MKRFIIIVIIVILLYLGLNYAYFHLGWYIDLHPGKEVTTFTQVKDKEIYVDVGKGMEPFEIRGVDMGSGIPGEWSTDFAIDKETYLRWFKQIKDMGANTIRVYTVQADTFYNAFYEYNQENEDPLYMIQGVWVNDYIQNSHVDAYSKEFRKAFQENCYTMINVIHGDCKLKIGEMASSGSGSFRKDVSPWVIGYILGVEWEDVTVAYTNEKYRENPFLNTYTGDYMYTTEEAEPFEAFLAEIGDNVIRYETERYKQQRLIAFSNWPTTDPMDYPENVTKFFSKCAKVDVEHIKTTDKVLSGQFASYHVYPYYPDYLAYVTNWKHVGLDNESDFVDEKGIRNSYKAYLATLTAHHTMPVVISEFGVSTGRGMAQRDQNTGRNQGNMSEDKQGQAIVDCYNDIMDVGCAGCCIFTWQDEWFKRTWNTMYAVDLKYTPYWSDYQTNEQYFGLLSFDPGDPKSICYVDGDVSEWKPEDQVTMVDDISISMKYDEKFIYYLVHKNNYDMNKDILYIPIDVTPNSGAYRSLEPEVTFGAGVDFLITIDGKENSRVQVQEYYEALRANYSENVYNYNTYYKDNIPAKDSKLFVNINMILQTATALIEEDNQAKAETYETGKLTYGNANPESKDFNSLADFMISGDDIEIKIPWQLLNFANPANMEIHDDYYRGNYGVDYMNINKMKVGIGMKGGANHIQLQDVHLKGWEKKPTYHERLKSSYDIVKDMWTK